MHKNKVELLAPAGNPEAFYGAIHAGADAVYLGGNRFGARAYAENFTEDQIISCIRYAHLFGRRVYLTVNTLVKESEFDQVFHYLKPLYLAGLDGVIVQDIGVLNFIRECFPDLKLHASTQMTVTGSYAAEMLKHLGVCRVVPARELSLEEIKALIIDTGLEIETFIHGAMCYCYSGQCLFSSILGGRSGNRGRCAQPCRLPYSLKDRKSDLKEKFPLSLKDMCTIEHIPDLLDAGIASLKIEGRMKKPEYAAGVTAMYRKYVDRYYAVGRSGYTVDEADMEQLKKLYIRSQIQSGYYHKYNGSEMVTMDSPAYSGSDETILSEIRENYINTVPKIDVHVSAYFKEGEPAEVSLSAGELTVSVSGDVVESASKQPITEENIIKQLKKMGECSFRAKDILVSLDERVFYSLKSINELRRKAVALLEDAIIRENGFCGDRTVNLSSVPYKLPEAHTNTNGVHVLVNNITQFRVLSKMLLQYDADTKLVKRIYINADLLYREKGREEILDSSLITRRELFLVLPYIIRRKDYSYLEKVFSLANTHKDAITGFLVRNQEELAFLTRKNYSGKLQSDTNFYIWNRKTLNHWKDVLTGYCLPFELNASEQRRLLYADIPCEKIIYGRIPMMQSANCVAKTLYTCKKNIECDEVVSLKDRYGKEFPVLLNCLHCTNIIYNSVPLSLHKDWRKWCDCVSMRLDFTVESERQTEAILSGYLNLASSGETDSVINAMKNVGMDYTTGHEKRGVE